MEGKRRWGLDLEGNASLVCMRRAEGAAAEGRRREMMIAAATTVGAAKPVMLRMGMRIMRDDDRDKFVFCCGCMKWNWQEGCFKERLGAPRRNNCTGLGVHTTDTTSLLTTELRFLFGIHFPVSASAQIRLFNFTP